jgi:hypothetical protein
MGDFMSSTKLYKVTQGPLGIRKEPYGDLLPIKLAQGDEITVTTDPVVKGGYIWLQHDKGWSALSDEADTDVFMLDISNRNPNEPRIFRVWAANISIRETPNGLRKPERLLAKMELKVDPTSRTEKDGYIWWKHDKGWTAERSSNSREIFMKEVFDTPAANPLSPDKKVGIPVHWTGKVNLQAATDVKVRGEPSTSSMGLLIRTMQRGAVLLCDMATLTEAENYYWVRHDIGWSAIQSVDGKTIFLAEAGTIPGLVAISADGPKATDLPQLGKLITRFPVNITDTGWFQYYGNNMFAMRNAASFGYDRYSQGLHGGLDFGNNDRPIPVFAGVEGKYLRTEYPSPKNARILVQAGDYTIIYQHLTHIRSFTPGQIISPDTHLADVEHHSINNGYDHLHFEIRFMKDWIINPLLMMPPEFMKLITDKFDPTKPNSGYIKDFPKSKLNCFYTTDTYKKWASPLDQPMIKLAGPVIGPRADLPKSDW